MEGEQKDNRRITDGMRICCVKCSCQIDCFIWPFKKNPDKVISYWCLTNHLSRSQNIAFRLHRGRSAEDLRKIRGTPPRKSWIQQHTGPPASKFWPQALAQDPRKTPRKSFGATGSISSCGGPVFQHCGLQVAPLGGGLPGGHRVAGHRVATNPKK